MKRCAHHVAAPPADHLANPQAVKVRHHRMVVPFARRSERVTEDGGYLLVTTLRVWGGGRRRAARGAASRHVRPSSVVR